MSATHRELWETQPVDHDTVRRPRLWPRLQHFLSDPRWKTVLALAALAIGSVLGLYWVWGLLFLIWVVNDLRSGYTGIVVGISRAASPVLYWICIALWFALGIWALLPPASGAGLAANATQLEERHIGEPAPAKDAATARAPLAFSVSVPEGWHTEETREPDSVSYHAASSDGAATLTVLAMDLGAELTLKGFIAYMETELAKDLPFIGTTAALPVPAEAPWAPAPGLVRDRRLYAGEWEGYEVHAFVGYRVEGRRGFAMLGVYEPSRDVQRDAVARAFRSFTL